MWYFLLKNIVLGPLLKIMFRPWVRGSEKIPSDGAAILASNHLSFSDSIFLPLMLRRPVVFLAKQSLFHYPLFSPWLRELGAIPIDRSSQHGVVGDMLALFAKAKEEGAYLWLGLSPEGTRKFTSGWRSGFYQLALKADVPLCTVRIDYGHKVVDFSACMRLTGNEVADYDALAKAFEGAKGFHSQQASPIQPIKTSSSVGTTQTP